MKRVHKVVNCVEEIFSPYVPDIEDFGFLVPVIGSIVLYKQQQVKKYQLLKKGKFAISRTVMEVGKAASASQFANNPGLSAFAYGTVCLVDFMLNKPRKIEEENTLKYPYTLEATLS